MRMKKLVALFCTLALTVAGFTGCKSSSSSVPNATVKESSNDKGDSGDSPDTVKKEADISKKIDLVIDGLDRGNSADNKWWPTTIVEEINKKLNINLTMVNYDQQKLGLDLASGQLPDVMLVYQANVESVVKGKHAVALNNYFDSTGKNLGGDRFGFRNQVMSQYQSGGDGNVYFTTPYVTVEGEGESGASLGTGYAVRWDLYKQIGAPELSSPDDYIEAMKKMQELYPKTAEGLPTYAMSMYNDVGLHAWIYHGVLDSDYSNLDGNMMYLIHKKTNEVVHNIISDLPDSPFWNDMNFYNKMWKEGLLDPDCFVTKGEDLTAKYTKGQYLGGINNWYYGEYNQNVLKDTNSTAGMQMLPCYGTGQGGYFPVGWNDKLLFVSAHSKNTERAIMLLDYLNSEEFARLQYSGIEGVNWEVGKDGKPAMTQETVAMKSDPASADANSKLALGSWGNLGGVGAEAVLSDGAAASLFHTPEMFAQGLTPTDKDMCETLGVSYPSEYAKKRVADGKSIDSSSFDRRFTAIMPSLPQDITRIDGNVKEIVTNALPALVQAKDDASFQAARSKLIADVKAANAEQSLKWWKDNVKTAQESVDSMN